MTEGGLSSRDMWKVFEPFHTVVHFAPETVESFRDLGLKGYWMGYVASRIAPLGAVTADVATASFFNFHPRLLRRALPDAWSYVTPAEVIRARLSVADTVLARILGEPIIRSHQMSEAAEIIQEAVANCDFEGRPLAAGYASLDWPPDPHLVVWHGATILREHRGEGHSAALLTHGLDGCEALVTLVAAGGTTRAALQPHRGWTDEEWDGAVARLQQRGWLDEAGAATKLGEHVRRSVERLTDVLAQRPWTEIGPSATKRLHGLLSTWAARIVEEQALPFPNPIGLRL